ncbi:UNVERIFIED_CONTAM: hypothetical protein K2H54_046361 [Gekko kuhli]
MHQTHNTNGASQIQIKCYGNHSSSLTCSEQVAALSTRWAWAFGAFGAFGPSGLVPGVQPQHSLGGSGRECRAATAAAGNIEPWWHSGAPNHGSAREHQNVVTSRSAGPWWHPGVPDCSLGALVHGSTREHRTAMVAQIIWLGARAVGHTAGSQGIGLYQPAVFGHGGSQECQAAKRMISGWARSGSRSIGLWQQPDHWCRMWA